MFAKLFHNPKNRRPIPKKDWVRKYARMLPSADGIVKGSINLDDYQDIPLNCQCTSAA
jgi:hypothetical protein